MFPQHLYPLKIINIFKINNMRRAIKTCKHNIIVTDAGCSINTTDFPVVKVYVTDFPVVKVHVDELSSARTWYHKLCTTLSVNINYRLLIKVYYRICTVRHIRIEIIYGSQNVFRVLTWVGRY